jgi:hypothetical protein
VSEPTPEVFVALFGDASRAAEVHAELVEMEAGGVIALLETMVIARDPRGRVAWDMAGPGAGHICSRADTIATMLGVLLSAEVLVTGLTAACRQGVQGEDAQRAFAERFARGVAPAIAPGGSLFIGVVEDRWVPEVERGLRGYHRLTGERP